MKLPRFGRWVFPRQSSFAAALAAVFAIGCAPLPPASSDEADVAAVAAVATLDYADFHAVDSQRVEQLVEAGTRAINREMRSLGSRRSSKVSPGPVLLDGSYLTSWNDQMLHLSKVRAEMTPPGSDLRAKWRELAQLGTERLIFSFVFLTRENRDFRKTSVVIANENGTAARCTIDGQEALDLSSAGAIPPGGASWRIAGRLTCPQVADDGRPLVNPNAGRLTVSLLPGSAVQVFEFRITSGRSGESVEPQG